MNTLKKKKLKRKKNYFSINIYMINHFILDVRIFFHAKRDFSDKFVSAFLLEIIIIYLK